MFYLFCCRDKVCTSKRFSAFSFVFGFILCPNFFNLYSFVDFFDWLYSFRDFPFSEFPLNFHLVNFHLLVHHLVIHHLVIHHLVILHLPYRISICFSFSSVSAFSFVFASSPIYLPDFLFHPFILWFNSFIFPLIHLFHYFFIHLFYFFWHPRPVFDLFHPLFRCIYQW